MGFKQLMNYLLKSLRWMTGSGKVGDRTDGKSEVWFGGYGGR